MEAKKTPRPTELEAFLYHMGNREDPDGWPGEPVGEDVISHDAILRALPKAEEMYRCHCGCGKSWAYVHDLDG